LLNLDISGNKLNLGLRRGRDWLSENLVFWINLSEDEVNITDQAFCKKFTDDLIGFTLGINGEGDDRDTRKGATTITGSVLRVADLAGGASWTNDTTGGRDGGGHRSAGGDLSQSGDGSSTDGGHLEEAWLLHEESLAASILGYSGLSVTDLSDSGNLVGGFSDLLGTGNDLLGRCSDLLLLGLDDLLEVRNLLLQSLLSSFLCFLGSLLDLLGHFNGCLRSVRSLNGLGL